MINKVNFAESFREDYASTAMNYGEPAEARTADAGHATPCDSDAAIAQGLAELLTSYTQSDGEQALIQTLGALTGHPAVLLDAHFMVLCQDCALGHAEYDFRTFTFILEAKQVIYHEPEGQILVSDMLVTHIKGGSKTYGFLVLQNIDAPPSRAAREFSLAVARLLGKGMVLASAPAAPAASENVLLELVNTTHPTMDLRLRMRSAGLRFDAAKRLIVFDVNSDDPLAENLRAGLPQGSHTARFKNSLILLLDALDGPEWEAQRADFTRAAEEYQLRAGISDVFTGSTHVAIQCRNAMQAIAFAEQFHLEGAIFEYSDFRFFDLLSVFDQPRELFRYMHPALQKLRDLDAKSGAVYFHTLHCFLKYNSNFSQTAKALFIHRNTLNYRLKRIEELTGLLLEDHRTRFILNYSYHIAEFLGLVEV